jgi:hypothetical protein
MNKRTGLVQDVRPPNFRENRVEEQSFTNVTLSDGTELTTCVDDKGVHLYMDWEAQVSCMSLKCVFPTITAALRSW